MANTFIYTFSDEGKEKLLSLQYQLLKYDAEKHTAIFLNKGTHTFSQADFPYAMSDVLTF